MPKQPPLSLPNKPVQSSDVAAFMATARHEPPPMDSAPASPGPTRGHIQMASGETRRRMVLSLPMDIGTRLDELSASTGASLTWHVTRLLREALDAEVTR